MLKEMTLLKPSWSQTKFMNMVGRWGLIGKDGLGEKLGGKNNNTIIKIYFITCTKLLKRELGHVCPEQPALDSRRIHSLAKVVGHYCEQIYAIVWERERQKVRVLGREADMKVKVMRSRLGWWLVCNWSHGDVHPGLLSKPMSGSMPCCSKLDQGGPEGMRVESCSHWLLHLLCGVWVRKKCSPLTVSCYLWQAEKLALRSWEPESCPCPYFWEWPPVPRLGNTVELALVMRCGWSSLKVMNDMGFPSIRCDYH